MVNAILFIVFVVLSVVSWMQGAIGRSIVFSFVSVSAMSGFLVGRAVSLESVADATFLVYVIIFLYAYTYFATSWLGRYSRNELINGFPGAYRISQILILILLPVLLLNVYILYSSVALVFIDALVDIDAYKNEGGVDEYLRAIVGSIPLFISRVFSPLGFVCIPLAILAWVRDQNMLGGFLFCVSLNWVLMGLTSFSRSGLVGYVFVVSLLVATYWNFFSESVRRRIIYVAALPTLAALSVFLTITVSRFSDPDYWVFKQRENSLVNDPVVFSALDYFGQWIEHSFVLSRTSDIFIAFNGHHVTTLFHQVGFPGLSARTPWIDYRLEALGEYAAYFVGLPHIFYIDFGLLGLPILGCVAIIFTLLLRRIRVFRSLYFFLSPVFLLVACMFFADSHFAYKHVQQAIFYTLAILTFVLFRFKFRVHNVGRGNVN